MHVATWFGVTAPAYAWALHGGIFVVWLPAVIVSQKLTAEFRQKDFWKAALRGCPSWAVRGVYVFGGYAILNFALFMFGVGKGAISEEAYELRGFSGHWMAFYSAGAAILYSATRAAAADLHRRCLQGHRMGAAARFCEQCGSPLREGGSFEERTSQQ